MPDWLLHLLWGKLVHETYKNKNAKPWDTSVIRHCAQCNAWGRVERPRKKETPYCHKCKPVGYNMRRGSAEGLSFSDFKKASQHIVSCVYCFKEYTVASKDKDDTWFELCPECKLTKYEPV